MIQTCFSCHSVIFVPFVCFWPCLLRLLVCTERPLTVIITPSNETTVTLGDKVSCSVEENVSSGDNYTWIDSATGQVIHDDSEWTVKPCPYQSCISIDDDDDDMMDNSCVNVTGDGLMMLECHVTVGMTTAHAAVVLHLQKSLTTCDTTTSLNGWVWI